MAQNFGFSNDVEAYSKNFDGTLWQFKIINGGKDIQTNIKLPGGGDFVDGFKLVNDLVKQVELNSSSHSPIQLLFPSTTEVVLPDTLYLTGDVTSMSQTTTQAAINTGDTLNQLMFNTLVLRSVADIISNLP